MEPKLEHGRPSKVTATYLISSSLLTRLLPPALHDPPAESHAESQDSPNAVNTQPPTSVELICPGAGVDDGFTLTCGVGALAGLGVDGGFTGACGVRELAGLGVDGGFTGARGFGAFVVVGDSFIFVEDDDELPDELLDKTTTTTTTATATVMHTMTIAQITCLRRSVGRLKLGGGGGSDPASADEPATTGEGAGFASSASSAMAIPSTIAISV